MKEHRFLNKIDFTEHQSNIPNDNVGNLKLYRLFSLVRDSYDLKSLDDAVGFPETLEQHLVYYKALIDTMELRGLTVPRSEKTAIEKMLSASMRIEKIVEPITIYHCTNCGSKLTKLDIESYVCGECHGRLPGYSEYILQKPFGGYKDFADCVSKNQDKKNPEAYCSVIMRAVEGKK